MATKKNGSEGAEPKCHEEKYEMMWTIPNWETVQRSETSLEAQRFEFVASKSKWIQSQWLMGFQINSPQKYFRIYCKLIQSKGFPGGKVVANGNCKLLKGYCPIVSTNVQKKEMKNGTLVEVSGDLGYDSTGWGTYINEKGQLTIKMELTLLEPDVTSMEVKMEKFHKASFAQVQANFSRLLRDESTADLKIVTSDEKELLAHRAILKVQCPVFESMFRSEFSEKTTGIVTVKDLTAKTMGIFLHYFYSGELLSSWKDDDTVLEFTYAVGKYQLTNILELLDDVLGSRDDRDATQVDLQLLDLAQKLNLKAAEMELVKRIQNTVNKATCGTDLLVLFNFRSES